MTKDFCDFCGKEMKQKTILRHEVYLEIPFLSIFGGTRQRTAEICPECSKRVEAMFLKEPEEAEKDVQE